jgi:very-short-patch-repair endonuclease
MHRGVYATFSGEPPRIAVLWAAVLSAGRGAMLSYRTAAELAGLSDAPSELIHVTVPSDRRVVRPAGIVIHTSIRAAQAIHPALLPPRTRIEETVLDLAASSARLDSAIAWVTASLGRRLTTQAKLGQALELRGKMRWRPQLVELLSTGAAGLHSILEWRYHHDVELPHNFPSRTRQMIATVDGRRIYRDVLYDAYALVVELDGRLAHPDDKRWQDISRDNAAAAEGKITLRYGWFQVTKTPCRVAAEVAQVLSSRGYTAARPCSANCPVGRHG